MKHYFSTNYQLFALYHITHRPVGAASFGGAGGSTSNLRLFTLPLSAAQEAAPAICASFGGAGGSTSILRLFTLLPLSAAQEAAQAICASLRCCLFRRRKGRRRGSANWTLFSLLSYMRYVRIKIMLQKCKVEIN